MGEIFVERKQIVVPGEKLATGMDILPSYGTMRRGEDIYAIKFGMVEIKDNRIVKVIPLSGVYIPSTGDTVIGKVVDVGFAGWQVDIASPYTANLPVGEFMHERVDLLKADLSRYLDIGDVVYAKVINVTKSKIVQLSMKAEGARKLLGGRIIRITPSKVPRLIGKKGSMIKLIKEATKCNIIVGQNGYVWIKGSPESEFRALEAIYKIERESHTSGLTDRIKNMLEGDGNGEA